MKKGDGSLALVAAGLFFYFMVYLTIFFPRGFWFFGGCLLCVTYLHGLITESDGWSHLIELASS